MYNFDCQPSPTKQYRSPRVPVCEDFSPWNCEVRRSRPSMGITRFVAKLARLARTQRVED